MKKDLHPNDYQPVVFQDAAANFAFLTRSTATSDETIKWEDGNEYPLIKIHISSESHPFYTGKEKMVDIEGRVDRFKAQAQRAKKKRDDLAKAAAKKTARKKAKGSAEQQKESLKDLDGKPAVSKKTNQKKSARKQPTKTENK